MTNINKHEMSAKDLVFYMEVLLRSDALMSSGNSLYRCLSIIFLFFKIFITCTIALSCFCSNDQSLLTFNVWILAHLYAVGTLWSPSNSDIITASTIDWAFLHHARTPLGTSSGITQRSVHVKCSTGKGRTKITKVNKHSMEILKPKTPKIHRLWHYHVTKMTVWCQYVLWFTHVNEAWFAHYFTEHFYGI